MEFKMYDRVIMRNPKMYWLAMIYGEKRDGLFFTANGVAYKECLPLEGNEHFIGTRLQYWTPDAEEIVLVRNDVADDWHVRVFKEYIPESEYPYTTFSVLIEDGVYDNESWKQCKGFIKPIKEG